jgi:hypothetical protein
LIVLADTDILFKLARCDLFDEFLTAFQLAPTDVRVLRTVRVYASRRRNRIGDDAYLRLSRFLDSVADIDVEPDRDVVAALTEQTDKNIDAGEAVLFAVGMQLIESTIVTGDKKSLVGLTSAATGDEICRNAYESIGGRVFCFEQVVEKILAGSGFDAVRDRLIRGRECDKGLALWLGSGLDANEERFRDGLASFLGEARRTTGNLLAVG